MQLHFATDCSACPRVRVPRRLDKRFLGVVALLLAFACDAAGAATLGRLAASTGLFAALTTVLLLQGWSVHLPMSALSTVGGVLLAAGTAAWLWRMRGVPAFAGAPSSDRGGRSRPTLIVPAAAATIVLPAGVESAALQFELRLHFVRLQAAWDLRDMQALRNLTTPHMLGELCLDAPCRACGPSRTDVVTLRTELLGFEDLAGVQWVSVEFSGLIREAADEGAHPFRELWMLTKSKRDDGAWRLARHQALL